MSNLRDTADYTIPAEDRGVPRAPFNWEAFGRYLVALKARRGLLLKLIVLFVLAAVLLYAVLPARYTANALVGPPAPSPTNSMMSSLSGVAGGGGASMLRRLVGGGGAPSANDPFQEYLQLLQSVRLVRVLIAKDHILQRLYPERWDEANKSWRSPGAFRSIWIAANRATGRNISAVPDTDSVMNFFSRNLYISNGTKTSGLRVSSLLSDNSYPGISFTFKDPREAESILNTILKEADDIIRADLNRDVSARLAYLKAQTLNVVVADQREALIAVLSEQEQLQMMLAADNRFASTLIDAPYASDLPTSPSPIWIMMLAGLVLAVIVWGGGVYLTFAFPFVARWFGRA